MQSLFLFMSLSALCRWAFKNHDDIQVAICSVKWQCRIDSPDSTIQQENLFGLFVLCVDSRKTECFIERIPCFNIDNYRIRNPWLYKLLKLTYFVDIHFITAVTLRQRTQICNYFKSEYWQKLRMKCVCSLLMKEPPWRSFHVEIHRIIIWWYYKSYSLRCSCEYSVGFFRCLLKRLWRRGWSGQ